VVAALRQAQGPPFDEAGASGVRRALQAVPPQSAPDWLAKNLVAAVKGEPLPQVYNGYSVCPFTVSRSTVVLSEFDDRYRPKPSIPFWTGLAKESRLTFLADRYVLPWVYWHMILKGRA
jgi:hypothetical protein